MLAVFVSESVDQNGFVFLSLQMSEFVSNDSNLLFANTFNHAYRISGGEISFH